MPGMREALKDVLSGPLLEERFYFDASYPDLFGGELASHYANEGQLRFLESKVLRTFKDPEILDHGCGFGLWMAALEGRGWHLTGVDLNRDFLDHARAKLGVRGELVEADVVEFKRENAFDVILSLGGTWGSFDRPVAPVILENIHDSLRPEGAALFQLVNPRFVKCYQPDRWWYRGAGDLMVLEQQDLSEPGYCTVEQLRFSAGPNGKLDGGWHRSRQVYYEDAEMRGLLQSAGFEIMGAWGDFAGSPICDEKTFLIYHCKKA